MANNVIGTCSIQRTYTGDNLYLSLSVNGPDCIFYDSTGIKTEISTTSPLVITPNVVSQSNSSFTIQKAVWKRDGSVVADSSDASKNTSGFSIDNSSKALKITSNAFANHNAPQNFVFRVELYVLCQNFTQTLVHDIIIPMQNSGGSSSYWGSVQLYGTGETNTFTASHTKIKIKRSLYLGGKLVPNNQYSTEWSGLASGTVTENAIDTNEKYIEIDRDQVNGQAFLSCKFKVNDQVVEATGIILIDSTDERIVLCPNTLNVAYNGMTEKVTPKLYNATQGKEEVCNNWTVEVKNNYNNESVLESSYTWNTSTPSAPWFQMAETAMYYDVAGVSTPFEPIVIFTAKIS